MVGVPELAEPVPELGRLKILHVLRDFLHHLSAHDVLRRGGFTPGIEAAEGFLTEESCSDIPDSRGSGIWEELTDLTALTGCSVVDEVNEEVGGLCSRFDRDSGIAVSVAVSAAASVIAGAVSEEVSEVIAQFISDFSVTDNLARESPITLHALRIRIGNRWSQKGPR
ncbi:hypothetical protein CYMTET_56471 [Cymbomonas tetramitiformis]|uniref:Uncharacterized protein n=1 Tax=Cymbomonas tetramitiformis TaxID=36881 RepID=A0AAE0BAV3_9CHLO|nr:hypothetical protein CYMTET_56471 [Cymbomonas tetramitiformis]